MTPGARIGPFEVRSTLGRGGQGTVLRVVDTASHEERAVKLLQLRGLGDRTLERIRREARLLSELDHPGLVRCHEFFERYSDGVAGLVMDLVVGRTLGAAASDPRMDEAHTWAALFGVAEALAHLHARGLLHRDVKEDNVLVTERFWSEPGAPGTVKLVDFGIAASVGNPEALTVEGGFIGTLPYLAPEILRPSPGVDLDTPRRDVFAFGVMACRLLHRRHPTRLGAGATLRDHLDAYRHMADCAWGASLHPVVRACVELDPSARLPDASAVLAAMRGPSIAPWAPTSDGDRTEESAPTVTVPADPVVAFLMLPGAAAGAASPPREPLAAITQPIHGASRGVLPAQSPSFVTMRAGEPEDPAARTPFGRSQGDPSGPMASSGALPAPPTRRLRWVLLGLLVAEASAGIVLVIVGAALYATVRDRTPSRSSPPLSDDAPPPPTRPVPDQGSLATCDCNAVRTDGYPIPFSPIRGGGCGDRAEASLYTIHPFAVSTTPGGGGPYEVCFGSICLPATGSLDSTSPLRVSTAALRAGGTPFVVRDARGETVATGVLPRYDLPVLQRTLCNGFVANARGRTVRGISFFLVPRR